MDNPNAIEAEFCSSFCSKFDTAYCKDKCQTLLIENIKNRIGEENERFSDEIKGAVDRHNNYLVQINEVLSKTMERLHRMKKQEVQRAKRNS